MPGASSQTCYAAMAADAIRAESSSGGAFTILARSVLARGGVVCGAAFDGEFRCRYEIVRDDASLARLRGSKYVRAALTRSFLADLRAALESGVPVLFSGTPCHVAAVRKMFANDADSLVTVDLICAGCPDQGLFDRYLDENWGRGNVAKYEFRSKARGWRHHHYLLHVALKDGREIWRERDEDEFMTAMSSGLGVSAGCFKCPFCAMDRPGDITIGDFWMVPEEMDDGKGTSALLLNTAKGTALFEAVRDDFVKVSEYPPSTLEQSQARLRSPRNVPSGREVFWHVLDEDGATVKDAVDKARPASPPPKVSVIIPVYNGEKYLGECLDSILGQSLKEIEVFCIDDGSTDGTSAILDAYASRDARVKLLATDHAGAYKARREGLRRASGTYVHFMDADDRLDASAYAELVDMADREALDQVVFSSDVFLEDGATRNLSARLERYTRYYALDDAICGRVMAGSVFMREALDHDSYFVSPPLRIIRRTVIADESRYGFPEARSRADNYFSTVSLYLSERVKAVNSRYYHRRIRAGSLSTAKGSGAAHARALLAVTAELMRFPAFARELEDEHSFAVRFLALRFRELSRWYGRIEGGLGLSDLQGVSLPNEAKAIFVGIVFPLMAELSACRCRPNSICGCLRYLWRRFWPW